MYDTLHCQHVVVQFLITENVSASQIYRRNQDVYGIECMSGRSVLRWCRNFNSGRSSTDDRSQFGQAHVVFSHTQRKSLHHRKNDLRDLHIVP